MTANSKPATLVAGISPSPVGTDVGLVPIDDVYSVLNTLIEPAMETGEVSLSRAVGRISALDVTTAVPLPRFDHSAVDGVGVGGDALGRAEPLILTVVGDVAAGQLEYEEIGGREAVRLFTGARIPRGVRAVVMDEKVRCDGNRVVLPPHVRDGDNIRRAGEDIAIGGTIVPSGRVLDSRHIAILAAAGHSVVRVMRKIRVAIVSTGDELVPAGMPLHDAQIHDVNGPMLSALAMRPWTDLTETIHVVDDGAELASQLRRLSGLSDVIISSGGAAGSQTDHTAAAILSAGGSANPLKLALKPGKPIVLGKIGRCLVLGFPGNPVASLVNFLLFGRPAMLALAGVNMERPKGIPVLLDADAARSTDRTEFAPGRIVRYSADGRPVAERLGKAGSGRLMPLVGAEGLVEIPSRSAFHRVPVFHPFDSSISV